MAGIAIDMQVQGLDALLRRMGNHQNTIETEARRAEHDGLVVLRDEGRNLARAIASDGRLPSSVTYEVMTGGLVGIIGSLAKTALSIETGRKKGEQPSAELLAKWIARKGLAGETVSVKTHRRTRATAGVRAAELDMAWKLAIAIRDRGTKALPFIAPAAKNKSRAIQTLFSDAVTRALRRIGNG